MTFDTSSPRDSTPGPEETQALLYARDLAQLYEIEKERRKELQIALESQKAVLRAMNDGVAIIDRGSCLIQANESFCKLFDLHPDAAPGRPLADIIPDSQALKVLHGWQETGKDTPAMQLEICSICDGQNRTLLLKATRMQDNYVVLVLHDQTAEQRAQLLKDEFLAILSHELRTPLTGILGFSSLLQDEVPKDGPLHDMARAIERSGRRMLGTVNELLQVAELQRSNIQNLNQPVYMEQVLERILSEMEHEAREREVHVDARIPELQGLVIPGNASLLRDAFRHLLRNAIQYNKPGGNVRLRTRIKKQELRLAVSDNGKGIPKHKQDLVFRSFYQAQSYQTRDEQGLGLGLTLAKRIIQLHGGSILLKSKPDKATCMVVILPLIGTVEAMRRSFLSRRKDGVV